MSDPKSRRGAPQSPRRPQSSRPAGESTENASGNIGSSSNTRAAVQTPTGFFALGVSARVDAGLAAAGFAAPFAIQTEAIPVALTGQDLCGRARTGSGKTLAFGVPIIERVTQKASPRKPRGVVLVPTRELAVQVTDVLAPIAVHCGVQVVAIYGGAAREKQVEQLARGVEVIIATPLRLIDLMKTGEADLSEVEVIVLDEADRMADEGFMPQVEWVLRHVTKEHQTMLFSATLDGQVATLVKRYMKTPNEVSIDAPTDTVGTMRHLFLGVHHMDKNRVIAAMARAGGQTVVFCDTKRACDKVSDDLASLGEKVSALHGDMAQGARERSLRKFAQRELNILVCTDVAARGIDIDDVSIVVHYVPPLEVKTYLHRSGRTARAGKDGWAVTLAEYNQHTTCRIIQRGLRLEAQAPIEVFSNDKRLADLSSFF
ncbi:MAG: DEAD/DEAH box helicase [Ilumatobacteraceae bacterium]|jgi:superfamily II DNA/RNA helicase|nr:DEAD/DEAH box helicase [Ilumatobacteraceae bacterium]MBJ7422400.1 DEAD/DEAH box helicase [Ilumatobacteraceae bacterium]